MGDKLLAIVCDHYLPGYKAGGPIVSLSYLVQILKDNGRVVVVTTDRDIGDQTPYPDIVLNTSIPHDGYDVLYVSSKLQLIKAVFKIKPDIIYLNSLFSRFSFVALISSFLLRSRPIKVLAPRGELGKGALKINPIRKRVFVFLFRSLFSRALTFHATASNEADDIRRELHAGSEVVANLPPPPYIDGVRRIKRPGEVRFVYLSRITRKKNLHIALKALKSANVGEIVFDIYGPLEDDRYWKECQGDIEALPTNIRASYKGSVHKNMVPHIFSKYHVLLFPTANENYGHVIAEALQSGTLPLISDQTPWRDLKLKDVGWVVNLNSLSELSQSINEAIHLDQGCFDLMSNRAMSHVQNTHNLERLILGYLRLLKME